MELAALRGKGIELMAMRLAPEELDEKARRQLGDRGFLVGMVSLLDVLLGKTYEQLFEQIPIHEDLQAAVIERAGQLGALLKIQVLLEKARFAEVEQELTALGGTPEQFDSAQQEALAWSFEMANEINH